MTPDVDRKRPLVSVVVPVYNAASYLRESLDSIVAQTYPELEVIVADDASSDGSAEIAESYGDPVTVLRRERNLGQFPNIEDAIRRVRGDFVCVFHADDIYHPQIVEREVAFLRDHPEVGTVICMDFSLDAQGRVYGRNELPEGIESGRPMDHAEVLKWLMVHRNTFLRTPGGMVRADLYREVGSFRDDAFGHAADLDMWLRLARLRPLAVLDDQLFGYRHTADSVDRTYARERREIDLGFRVIERHLEETGYEPPDEAWAAFLAHLQEDRLLLAARDYIRRDKRRMDRRLREVDLGALARAPGIRRFRLLLIYGLLRVFARLPWLSSTATVFHSRLRSDPASSPTRDRK